ncbi:MAG TPA: DUF2950 domain-containing protein [Candidatus Angelobacter sp.]|jgi:hypothetical protein|nr:DUF2950 domain-containing protein [Candidatus Angelobacter sp.]
MKARHDHHLDLWSSEPLLLGNRSASVTFRLVLAAVVVLALCMLLAVTARATAGTAADVKQTLYPKPQDATDALVNAAKSKDRAAMAAIFGAEYEKLLSGDQVQDNNELELFNAAVEKGAELKQVSDTRYIFSIGEERWPFPIPIVKAGDQWRFDTAAGMEEILNRRIGENELSAISVCRAYVLAQWEYFTEGDHDNDGVAEYAQRLLSHEGQKDGLFWETPEGQQTSPLGVWVASARTEGYEMKQHPARQHTASAPATPANYIPRHPYKGYFFKILKQQGPYAPGRKYNYVINGNMIAGYALVAIPEKWGSSGVMTFIVNQQGRVYQKNLGPNTEKAAGQMIEYNPDPTWKLVKD